MKMHVTLYFDNVTIVYCAHEGAQCFKTVTALTELALANNKGKKNYVYRLTSYKQKQLHVCLLAQVGN